MSELAICTNPLAREGMHLCLLDRVLDTRGGVHDSSTPAHAGRSPAAQLQPQQLPANSIQSPYIHRANGLLQIAVSTPLRIRSIGAREALPAERRRYGTSHHGVTGADALTVG